MLRSSRSCRSGIMEMRIHAPLHVSRETDEEHLLCMHGSKCVSTTMQRLVGSIIYDIKTHTQVQLAQAKAQLAHVKMQLAEAKVQLAWRSSITVSTHYSGFGSRKILLDLTFRLYGLGLLPISLFGPNLLGKSAKCLRMQTKIAQPGHDGVQSHSAN
eukprot:scaffold142708_cov13-Tisochrysis_lutea.AAC.1